MSELKRVFCHSEEGVGITARLLAEKFPNLDLLMATFVDMADLSPLANMPLVGIHLTSCNLGDLSPLAAHPTLKTLRISGQTKPVDVSPLAKLKIKLLLGASTPVNGIEKLGPDVKVFR